MEAFAWHQLWPTEGLVDLVEVLEFTVDKVVPGMIKILFCMGWCLATVLLALPDLTIWYFLGVGEGLWLTHLGVLLALGLWGRPHKNLGFF